ncbi:MAG: hypothetical protein NTV97_19530 [Alphaproteobacteria bacterium]|nr:hypothetical protein [Alphaproteobacteria bacterium]
MLITPRRIDLLTGFLAAFAVFCFVMAAADFQSSYCGHQSNDQHQASAPAQPNATGGTLSGQNADQKEQGKHAKPKPSLACGVLGFPGAVVAFMDHHEGFFVGGFTFFLFLSTTLLWRSTERLWEAGERQAALTRDSINLAREEFNATHRPRIGIRGVHTLTVDREGFLGFVYVNRGIGTAKITRIGCAVIVTEYIRNAPAFEVRNITDVELKSGDSEFYEYNPRNIVEFSFGRGFDNNSDPRDTSSTAYFVGFVAYEDSDGRQRETGFCRKNAPGTDIWTAVENSGYEYED